MLPADDTAGPACPPARTAVTIRVSTSPGPPGTLHLRAGAPVLGRCPWSANHPPGPGLTPPAAGAPLPGLRGFPEPLARPAPSPAPSLAGRGLPAPAGSIPGPGSPRPAMKRRGSALSLASPAPGYIPVFSGRRARTEVRGYRTEKQFFWPITAVREQRGRIA